MDPKDRFSTLGDDAPSFTLSLADLCNGIDCITRGRFPAEAVIEMAGHILVKHVPEEGNPDEVLTGLIVNESWGDEDAPVH